MKHKQHHYSKRTVDLCEFKLTQYRRFLCLLDIKTYERLRKLISDILTQCIFRGLLQIWRRVLGTLYTCLLFWHRVVSSFAGLSHCIQSLSESNLVSQRSHKTWRKFVVNVANSIKLRIVRLPHPVIDVQISISKTYERYSNSLQGLNTDSPRENWKCD